MCKKSALFERYSFLLSQLEKLQTIIRRQCHQFLNKSITINNTPWKRSTYTRENIGVYGDLSGSAKASPDGQSSSGMQSNSVDSIILNVGGNHSDETVSRSINKLINETFFLCLTLCNGAQILRCRQENCKIMYVYSSLITSISVKNM